MNDWKEKLRTLLDTLGTQHIDTFMKSAKVADYARYGFAYRKATEDKIAEAKAQIDKAKVDVIDEILEYSIDNIDEYDILEIQAKYKGVR